MSVESTNVSTSVLDLKTPNVLSDSNLVLASDNDVGSITPELSQIVRGELMKNNTSDDSARLDVQSDIRALLKASLRALELLVAKLVANERIQKPSSVSATSSSNEYKQLNSDKIQNENIGKPVSNFYERDQLEQRFSDIPEYLVNDRSLALSLASLVNVLYQLEELNKDVVLSKDVPEQYSSETPISKSSSQVVATEAALDARVEKLGGTLTRLKETPKSELNQEQTTLWEEADSLMAAVRTLCQLRSSELGNGENGDKKEPIGSTAKVTETTAPVSDSIQSHSCDTKTSPSDTSAANAKNSSTESLPMSAELEAVVKAIDRVLTMAPKLFNQTYILTRSRTQLLSSKAIISVVERLSRGRMDDQRAGLDSLSTLIETLVRCARSRLDNQKAAWSENAVKRIEMGRLGDALSNVEQRTRMSNQDFDLSDTRMLRELERLQTLLSKSIQRSSGYSEQRYALSETKEHAMFVSGVMTRMERLPRMENQQATLPTKNNSGGNKCVGSLDTPALSTAVN